MPPTRRIANPPSYVEDEQVSLVPDQGEDESDVSDGSKGFIASATGRDWTVETLVSQMRKGRIDLEPEFQRRNAWLSNRKSKLIESILLGFPIPQIVIAEKLDAPGFFFVLDGKQRLLALRQFFSEPETEARDRGFEQLTLHNLEVMTDVNGMDLHELTSSRPDLVASLENHTIRTVTLAQWNSEKLLLSLFLRLNTGSVALSPQELRQALIPGAFMSWLDRVSGSMPGLRDLLGNSHPDRRMVDAELVLRHLAFSRSPLRYRGNLKQFLDQSSRVFNDHFDEWEPELEDEAMALNSALEALLLLFGKSNACRKWTSDHFERAVNRAVFDVQAYSLSWPDVRRAVEADPGPMVDGFQIACNSDEAFVRSITATTKTRDAFRIRHITWARILREGYSLEYESPASLESDD